MSIWKIEEAKASKFWNFHSKFHTFHLITKCIIGFRFLYFILQMKQQSLGFLRHFYIFIVCKGAKTRVRWPRQNSFFRNSLHSSPTSKRVQLRSYFQISQHWLQKSCWNFTLNFERVEVRTETKKWRRI